MIKSRTILFVLLVCFVGCASSQKKAVEAQAKDPKYQYSLGVFYLNSGNADEAIKYLNRSITLDPRYYLAYNALGMATSMKGNLESAIKDYQRCLEIAPEFSEARNNLGSVYQELGFIDKAGIGIPVQCKSQYSMGGAVVRSHRRGLLGGTQRVAKAAAAVRVGG